MAEINVLNTQNQAIINEESLPASLGLNTQLFVFQLVNFIIVAIILWFLILKPLTKKLEERKKMIDESIDNAKEIETNLALGEKEYQDKLKEAKGEANKVIEKAHSEGKQLGEDMKNKAKTDVEAIVTQAKKSIQTEKVQMMEEIRQESATLIVSVLEKILNEKMDGKIDKKIIEDSLKELKK
ncbi:MAG: ATP synthase F0 subunit B [Candidatus Magasanikbacteria bacterium CG_4_10_14_0_8_um_filter_32_14]|uniref:ATP synthase subunit b n=2 Tax=Candidatus Magasanikiibacteriota TaxID=1752731 RepID=A0A2M7RA47_9BACT|nr:MAG: ATP synthase F0 subunit B [Candidatus Magasanikbacteria bacterium CG1_02_32_51]PIY93417.1 MAG: ATP synthase F0 subunit B [Candidatus Magasanikbacteria bacterium CG_4_10_14_0_8_um_filter_32_14]